MTDAERRIADELRKAAITRMTEAYFSGHVLSMYVQTPGGKWSRIAQRCRVVVGDDFFAFQKCRQSRVHALETFDT